MLGVIGPPLLPVPLRPCAQQCTFGPISELRTVTCCPPTTSNPCMCTPSTNTFFALTVVSPGSPISNECNRKHPPTTWTSNALIVNHPEATSTVADGDAHANVTGADPDFGSPKIVTASRPASFAGYDPPCTLTVSPGAATSYARWNVRH